MYVLGIRWFQELFAEIIVEIPKSSILRPIRRDGNKLRLLEFAAPELC